MFLWKRKKWYKNLTSFFEFQCGFAVGNVIFFYLDRKTNVPNTTYEFKTFKETCLAPANKKSLNFF